MAKFLGLSFNFHSSAAAIVGDGEIIAAASEERFSRVKNDSKFPKHSIEYCLRAANLNSINDIEAIVYYEKPIKRLHRVLETYISSWPMSFESFTRRFPNFLNQRLDVRSQIFRELPSFQNEVLFSEHHLSHAAHGYFTSSFSDAGLLIVDNVGEWDTISIGVAKRGNIEIKSTIQFPHSIGMLYSAMTQYLGFTPDSDEWKVMGLAAYGSPKYLEKIQRLANIDPDGVFELNMDYFKFTRMGTYIYDQDKWIDLFGIPPRDSGLEIQSNHEDLAASIQKFTETCMIHLSRVVKKYTDSENLIISGGVALNGLANSKVLTEGAFGRIWVPPGPGDDGAALGAALVGFNAKYPSQQNSQIQHSKFGPEYSDAEIEKSLLDRGYQLKPWSLPDLTARVCELIESGKVVGLFQGRMEFGPRALGSRSLLADARQKETKERLNRIKGREWFRPIAPAVLKEDAARFFKIKAGQDYSFMSSIVPTQAIAKDEIPGVVHEDMTARIQIVDQPDSFLHALLKELKKRTGTAVIANTSFNGKEEPIVCRPADAINCFESNPIDALVIGPYILERRDFESRSHLEPDFETMDPKEFHKAVPFNFFSNSVDGAKRIYSQNPIRDYPNVHSILKQAKPGLRVIDLGCGSGWFLHACRLNYKGIEGLGIDSSEAAISQAQSIDRLIDGSGKNQYLSKDLLSVAPETTYDFVNSLGVLHHTKNCTAAIRHVSQLVSAGGYIHLGLYHQYGREPFKRHFDQIVQTQGEESAFMEFKTLFPADEDAHHLKSWFYDQILHPFETLHTFQEISALLAELGYTLCSTSIDGFKSHPDHNKISLLEKQFEERSLRALKKRKFFPGFFTILAKRNGSVNRD